MNGGQFAGGARSGSSQRNGGRIDSGRTGNSRLNRAAPSADRSGARSGASGQWRSFGNGSRSPSTGQSGARGSARSGNSGSRSSNSGEAGSYRQSSPNNRANGASRSSQAPAQSGRGYSSAQGYRSSPSLSRSAPSYSAPRSGASSAPRSYSAPSRSYPLLGRIRVRAVPVARSSAPRSYSTPSRSNSAQRSDSGSRGSSVARSSAPRSYSAPSRSYSAPRSYSGSRGSSVARSSAPRSVSAPSRSNSASRSYSGSRGSSGGSGFSGGRSGGSSGSSGGRSGGVAGIAGNRADLAAPPRGGADHNKPRFPGAQSRATVAHSRALDQTFHCRLNRFVSRSSSLIFLFVVRHRSISPQHKRRTERLWTERFRGRQLPKRTGAILWEAINGSRHMALPPGMNFLPYGRQDLHIATCAKPRVSTSRCIHSPLAPNMHRTQWRRDVKRQPYWLLV